MPEAVKITDFSGGWAPSDNELNGRKNVLLKMTGVTLDENGSLSMAPGTKKGSFTYPAIAHTLFAKYMCGTLNLYAALVDGSVYRNSTKIISTGNGSLTRAAFGVSGDAVVIFSGNQRIKDTCSGVSTSFGAVAPDAAPLVNVIPSTPVKTADSIIGDLNNWVHNNGQATNYFGEASSFVKNSSDSFTADVGFNWGNGDKTVHSIDFNSKVADFPKDLSGAAEDTFEFNIDSNTIGNIAGINISLLLQPRLPGTSWIDGNISNWFYITWDLAQVQAHINGNRCSFKAARSEFLRYGSNFALDWTQIYGIQIDITFKAHSYVLGVPQGPSDSITVSGFKYSNSTSVESQSIPLNGTYEYVQVNVITGTGTSVLGPVTSQVISDHNEIEVIPQDPTLLDQSVDEVWLFRRGGTLDAFYRVAAIPYGSLGPFYDSRSDEDVLAEGVTLENFLSVTTTGLTDEIIEMVGPVNGRMLYFSVNRCHFSLPNAIDHYNPAQSINIAGSVGEVFLWAKKAAENVVIIGTNKDLYTLIGSMITFPDGSLDVSLRSMGIDKPPICRDVSVFKGNLIYYVQGGWVILSLGNDYTNLTEPSTDLIYKGEQRYEYGGVPTQTDTEFRYSVAVTGNKLFCIVPIITNYNDPENSTLWSKRMECYDFGRKYWIPYNYFPDLLFTGEDGKLYGFFNTLLRLDRINYPFAKTLNTT